MLDRAVLAGGVHRLEDEQQRARALRVEPLLQLVQLLEVCVALLLRALLVSSARSPGSRSASRKPLAGTRKRRCRSLSGVTPGRSSGRWNRAGNVLDSAIAHRSTRRKHHPLTTLEKPTPPASNVAVALLSLAVGIVLARLGVVTLALPEILRDFGAEVGQVAWVLIAFNLVLALAAVPAARVCVRGDRGLAGAVGLVGVRGGDGRLRAAPSLERADRGARRPRRSAARW